MLPVDKWKYQIASKNLTDDVTADQAGIQMAMDSAAKNGWELVAAVPHPAGYLMLIFKKPA
jgi:hypothetical protein